MDHSRSRKNTVGGLLPSIGANLRVIIVGASGGIGRAFVETFSNSDQVEHIYALSRQGVNHTSKKVSDLTFDITNEGSIISATQILSKTGPYDLILITTGLLQGDGISPEKNIRAISFDAFEKSFAVNTIGPAITAKYLLPLMRRDRKSVFAVLSARVGSISDNRLGGWYAYRASKAALNMLFKTLSIEYGRRFKDNIIIGSHPGTVDTALSKPFQSNVPDGKLFTPEFCANNLIKVIDDVKSEDSGSLIAWDGQTVPF